MQAPLTVLLHDGRTLAWAEYGDPAGPPLFFFHGLPGSRLFHFPEWTRPGGTKLRVIAPDRPGVGSSTFLPGRRLLDWPHDVHALAEHLGVSRYLVAGISGGGPHALVCAARLPEEVAACALLSSGAPFDDPEVVAGMHRANRMVFGLARRAPLLLTAFMWLTSKNQRTPSQERYLRAAKRLLPPADIDVLRDPEIFAMLMEAGRESTRVGVRGVVQEAVLFAQPWGFSPAEVRVPVFLWQGGADRNVPVAAGRLLEREIPGCVSHFDDDAGHTFTLRQWPEIEAELLAKW